MAELNFTWTFDGGAGPVPMGYPNPHEVQAVLQDVVHAEADRQQGCVPHATFVAHLHEMLDEAGRLAKLPELLQLLGLASGTPCVTAERIAALTLPQLRAIAILTEAPHDSGSLLEDGDGR